MENNNLENNNKNNSGCGVAVVIIIFIIRYNHGSEDRQSDYEKSLYDAYDKIQNGQPLTREEQRAWDDFKEWEEKNY